ncbi:PH domain-containing protein [Paractinoplanes maris]|uniref:PH domain-containing protein n=1 Tax=Paractinoplanes maris TaxID=1734446 RepID=UPI002021A172|nr:PH domain-containing protein [Actinoplanes maris]
MLPIGLVALAVSLIGAGVDRGGWLLTAAVPVASVAMAGAGRSWALRVEAQPHGIVVVNWFRVIRLWWPDIARCGTDDEGLWVRRADGSEVRVAAFQYGSRALTFARRPSAAAAAELERLRKRYQ